MSFARPTTPQRGSRTVRVAVAVGLLASVAGLLHPVPTSATPVVPAASTPTTYTVKRVADADSFSASAAPRYRFGQRAYLEAGTYGHDVLRSYLHFSAPATDTLVSAKLTLTRAGHWSAGTLAAATTTARWSERTLTRRNAPKALTWLGGTWVHTGSSSVTVDVTKAFRAHRSNTIALQMLGPRMIAFASRQASAGRPVLTVVMSTRVAASNPGNGGPAPINPVGTCGVSAKLVPTCGRWWGMAPERFTSIPLTTSLPMEDTIADRRTDILHEYHVNDQLFPTATEKAMALAPDYPKLLLINWKPATDKSWAAIAAGGADARIDREAKYINANFPYRFFLAIYHEPEDNVQPTPGSGYTAADYAAMYRHVVLRLRADGVNNAVTVMDYMGFDRWGQQSWFNQLWPGDDVVDWIGFDPYGSGTPGGYGATNFKTLVDRPAGNFPGYYSWATANHPGKPMMLCEWGVEYDPNHPTGQSSLFDSMKSQLADFPQLKALVYFDMPSTQAGNAVKSTGVTQNPVAQSAYRQMASSLGAPQPGVAYAS